MNLTKKQRIFAEHYAMTGKATESARLAGYSRPAQSGQLMARDEELMAYITNVIAVAAGDSEKEASDKRIATAVERQEFWTSMMRDENVSPKDRLRASEILGKAQGDFIERNETTLKIDVIGGLDEKVIGEIQGTDIKMLQWK